MTFLFLALNRGAVVCRVSYHQPPVIIWTQAFEDSKNNSTCIPDEIANMNCLSVKATAFSRKNNTYNLSFFLQIL